MNSYIPGWLLAKSSQPKNNSISGEVLQSMRRVEALSPSRPRLRWLLTILVHSPMRVSNLLAKPLWPFTTALGHLIRSLPWRGEGDPRKKAPTGHSRSWSKEEKQLLCSLPVEIRSILSRRENERDTSLRTKQNQLAEERKALRNQACSMQAQKLKAEPEKEVVENNE